eukprot:CFRG2207T1
MRGLTTLAQELFTPIGRRRTFSSITRTVSDDIPVKEDLYFTKQEIVEAANFVHKHMPSTAQLSWPQLNQLIGVETWVKHENHNLGGNFKMRGGFTFIDWLQRVHPEANGIVTATRGNHGQSQARSAARAGLTAKVIVPKGNSKEKNMAMKAFGAEVIECGSQFEHARDEALRLSEAERLYFVPPFHRELVRGVCSYAYEFFMKTPPLDAVFVSVGGGSGASGLIAVRDALGLKTKIVGVVAAGAPTVKLSFDAGKPVIADTPPSTFADGVAVQMVISESFEILSKGLDHVVSVRDDEIANAIRIYYREIHNIAEGAGAVPLAALIKDKEKWQGRKVGLILSGGNIDKELMVEVLLGKTPCPQ